jgi:uncharacterized membrane protein YphA (DoxX/SURF4 family)
MKRISQWNRPVGLLGMRLVIGFLSAEIAMHKLFIEGLASQMRWFEQLAAWFPDWVLWSTNVYCAVVELVGGILLVLGLGRDLALWAILSVLVIVTFGHGLEAAVWDIQQMIFRLALVIGLLLLPADWDTLRLDTMFEHKAGS